MGLPYTLYLVPEQQDLIVLEQQDLVVLEQQDLVVLEQQDLVVPEPVSYTHLTLPTICSV